MSIRNSQHRAAAVFLAPFVVLYTACFLLPIGYAVYQSLMKVERQGPLGLGGSERVFAGVENYRRALTDDAFVDSLVRILAFVLVQVPIMVVLAAALALLLESASARGVWFFRTAYFVPYGVPGVVASILWGFLYVPGVSPIVDGLSAIGLDVDLLGANTILFSIVNIVVWEFAGYNMLVLVAQLKSIDTSLYEAAHIDGANAWQVIRHLKLPLLKPSLVLTTVFTIIGTFQLFAEPLVLRPLSTAIDTSYTPNLAAYTQAFTNNNYGLAAAQAVVLALGACVLSFGFLRLTRGGDGR